MWYFVVGGLLTLWVVIDARKRDGGWFLWGLFTFLLPMFGWPGWMASRPLLAGETREGGRVWNFLKFSVVSWTVLCGVWAFWYLAFLGEQMQQAPSEAAQAGTAIGGTLGLGMMGAVWFGGCLVALVLGLLFKNSTIEEGPRVASALAGAARRADTYAPPPVQEQAPPPPQEKVLFHDLERQIRFRYRGVDGVYVAILRRVAWRDGDYHLLCELPDGRSHEFAVAGVTWLHDPVAGEDVDLTEFRGELDGKAARV